MKVLALANQKGGVGKSAVATQLALYLATAGRKVLVIDLDHQANTTRALRAHPSVELGPTTAQVLAGAAPLGDAGERSIRLIGADDALSALERQPDQHNAIVNALKRALDAPGAAWDVAILDTNPNPDIRYAAALICASHVLSPLQLNQEALDGIGGLMTHPRYGLARIRAALNPSLQFIGLLPNMVEPTPFQRANFAALASQHAAHLLQRPDMSAPLAIPKRSAIAEAQAEGVFLGSLKKTAARDAWREIEPVFRAVAERLGLAS